MIRLLIVEDSESIQKMIRAALSQYRTEIVSNLKEAKNKLLNETFNLAIFDVVLPDGNAFDFLSKIQSEQIKIPPIIFLTSKNTLQDKLVGFELGGEDYITKPFEPLELKARVASRLRASIDSLVKGDVLEIGDMKLDLLSQKAFIMNGNNPVELSLTPVEFKLLHYLSKHPTEVISRDRLLDTVWGSDIHVTDRTVDTHVSNLRKKMKDSACSIAPVYGEGYRFKIKA